MCLDASVGWTCRLPASGLRRRGDEHAARAHAFTLRPESSLSRVTRRGGRYGAMHKTNTFEPAGAQGRLPHSSRSATRGGKQHAASRRLFAAE